MSKQFHFYLAYTLVWALLLLYLVRLHLMVKRLDRERSELGDKETSERDES